MSKYGIIPYLGTVAPNNQNWSGGILSKISPYVIGCWNSNGNQSPVLAFQLSTGGYSGGYMSLSSGYVVKNTNSTGSYILSVATEYSGIIIYNIRFSAFLTEMPYTVTETVTLDEAYQIVTNIAKHPITYQPINCQLSGPSSASSGSNVSVIVTPNSGKIIRNPTQGSSISVYDKNGYIPFTYDGNAINFTVP